MKLPGVESADVSLKSASADIRLKADNRITMTELRQVLKKNGYPTRDAQIEARGRIDSSGDGLVLDLLNGSSLPIGQNDAGAKPSDRVVQVSGISRAQPKDGDRVILQMVR